jgi:hypothetical protein
MNGNIKMIRRNWPSQSMPSQLIKPVDPQMLRQGGSGARAGAVLPPGTRLYKGDRRTSPSGQYELVMQYDGDVVLYRNNPDKTQTRIFETGTYEGNPYGLGIGDHTVIQADGSLVIYGASKGRGKPGDVIWTSNIQPKRPTSQRSSPRS